MRGRLRGKKVGLKMAPKGRLLNFTEMQTLLDGAEQFCELFPRRWSYISRYVAERTKGFDNLPRFLVGERCSEIFKATEADCRMMHKVLVEKYPAVVEFATSEKSEFFISAEKDAFKPVVNVPPILFCCQGKSTSAEQCFYRTCIHNAGYNY